MPKNSVLLPSEIICGISSKNIEIQMIKVGVIGAGAMGAGIAQVASQAGHEVVLSDTNLDSLKKAKENLVSIMNRLVEKGRLNESEAQSIQNRITYSQTQEDFSDCGLVIEAIIENLGIKKQVFSALETIVSPDCIISSNQ